MMPFAISDRRSAPQEEVTPDDPPRRRRTGFAEVQWAEAQRLAKVHLYGPTGTPKHLQEK